MPNYEYECQSCGYKFEKFQYMNDAPIKECPKCHANKAKRLISAGSGIIFKGSGFYATDYRKDKGGKSKSRPATCPAAKKNHPGCSGCPAH
ncbi:MAG: zinc ribbon domain-containing protein [Candidatus Omnitrophica bacterium]|nr:zinc ribbon domain-containing protein [Candidatus Omnitrophota bacterium]MDD5352175.1 zinc ribbon domain-containing protein [Candidatus Omnitrophota bacterium]MDD5549773.1 zinc ribbon domain-containing protein [Candidatus Omnitrophota bacterium]